MVGTTAVIWTNDAPQAPAKVALKWAKDHPKEFKIMGGFFDGKKLDAAYEYINWYLSGWVGAYLNRQGYYSAAMDTAKQFMSADEWGFWVDGKPAQGDILSPDGKVMEKAGAVRDGGSFYERMGKVACWNSVMDEDRYMVSKWNEFIAA